METETVNGFENKWEEIQGFIAFEMKLEVNTNYIF